MNIFILFFILLPACARCHLRDIVMTDDQPTVGPAPSPEKTFHFLSTGVTHIFWSHVASSNFTQDDHVTVKCRAALAAVSTDLSKGHILPFHFVDASAKTPPGFIRATMSSLGDYDQCLTIHATIQGLPMLGKYCAVDLFPVRTSLSNDRKYTDTMTTGKLTFDQIAVFKRTPFIHSLCVPHQCSEVDVKHILSTGKSPVIARIQGE